MDLLRSLSYEIREKKTKVTAEYVDEDSDGLLDRCSESSDILESRTESLLLAQRQKILWLKIASALLLLMLLVLLGIFLKLQGRDGPSYETGFETDLQISRGEVGLQNVMFTGGIHYNDEGHVYIEDLPGPKYVGPPEQAIDDAWDDLLLGQIINLPADEAQDISSRTYFNPRYGFYETGIDAYHQLHCINRIRKRVYKDYYGNQDKSEHGELVHVDHCMDYLRQSIQCSADMTPVIMYYQPWINGSLPYFEQQHTCRNWNKLSTWVRGKLKARPRGQYSGHGEHGH